MFGADQPAKIFQSLRRNYCRHLWDRSFRPQKSNISISNSAYLAHLAVHVVT